MYKQVLQLFIDLWGLLKYTFVEYLPFFLSIKHTSENHKSSRAEVPFTKSTHTNVLVCPNIPKYVLVCVLQCVPVSQSFSQCAQGASVCSSIPKFLPMYPKVLQCVPTSPSLSQFVPSLSPVCPQFVPSLSQFVPSLSQFVPVYSSLSQCVPVCFSMLQYASVCFSMLQSALVSPSIPQ